MTLDLVGGDRTGAAVDNNCQRHRSSFAHSSRLFSTAIAMPDRPRKREAMSRYPRCIPGSLQSVLLKLPWHDKCGRARFSATVLDVPKEVMPATDRPPGARQVGDLAWTQSTYPARE